MIVSTYFVFSAICLCCAIGICTLFRKEKLIPAMERLPRARSTGAVLIGVSLFWCVWHLRPILAPDSFFHPLLIPGAVIGTVLCAIYLDFLFARGLAAFTILTASYFLSSSFRLNVPAYSMPFAAGLFLLGTCAILIGAKPWWMRSWIRCMFRNKTIRLLSALFFLYLAATSAALIWKGGLL